MISLSRENLSSRFPTRTCTNQALQPQKLARGLDFRIIVLCSEKKGTDHSATTQLICAFVFAYAESRYSHDAAHKSELPKVNIPFKHNTMLK